MKRVLLLLLVVSAGAIAQAQTFDAYVKLRKSKAISRPTDPIALESFVGDRTLEVKAEVKGFVRSGESEMLILESDSGGRLFVRCTRTPDWLRSTGVKARLLVEAHRETPTSVVESVLLGAATEQQMAAWEAKYAKPSKARSGAAKSSRNGRPRSLPGSIPTLSGTIGGKSTMVLPAGLAASVPSYTAFILRENPRLGEARARSIAETVLAYSDHFGVDARLVMALVLCESGFDPNSRSHVGAMGLGQLMPGTARELGVSNAYDTRENLYGTVKLLRNHIERYSARTDDSYQALVLALAAYNAGPGAVSKHGGVPPYRETQQYVRKVVDTYYRLSGS